MHDSGGMRFRDRIRDLRECVQQRCESGSLDVDLLAQRPSVHELGDEIRHVLAARADAAADIVDLQDVRMVQRRSRARLAFETSQCLGTSRERRVDHLDRHLAAQARITGAIHRAHPAGAEEADDFVWTETGARSQWHRANTPPWRREAAARDQTSHTISRTARDYSRGGWSASA